MKLVSVHVDRGIAELTLHRADKRNALTKDMLANIVAAIDELSFRADVKAMVVLADGPFFCAGADLTEFRELSDEQARAEWTSLGLSAFHGLAEFPSPVIAGIQGGAIGGGMELAIHCDLRILGRTAVLSMPEVSLGWRPDWGALERLPALVTRPRAIHMMLTGLKVTSKEALEWGLVTEVSDAPQDRARELARFLSGLPVDVVRDVLEEVRPRLASSGGGAT